MDFYTEIIENVISNLYSYAVYIVLGIIIYFIIRLLTIKLKLGENIVKIVIIFLSLFLPICSCISITFLLYKKTVKDEKFILIAYIISVFFNISAFIYIYIFLGVFALFIYILIPLIVLIVIYKFLDIEIGNNQNNNIDYKEKEIVNNIQTDKNNEISFKKRIIEEVSYVSRFVFVHYIGIFIFSVIIVLFKSIQYVDITNNNTTIFLLNNILFKYSCIPYDIATIREFLYRGYSVTFVVPVFVVSVIANIPEVLLLINRLKNKYIIFVTIIMSSIFVGLLSSFFGNNDALRKISINYDDKLFTLANNLNINPNGLVRNASIIIYIILFLYFISQKKGELKL